MQTCDDGAVRHTEFKDEQPVDADWFRQSIGIAR